MLNFVKGNLCDAPERMILQGCNAQGVMGSGVAKAIREKWPHVYTEYRKTYEEAALGMGIVIFTPTQMILNSSSHQNNQYVASIISQKYYGYDQRKYASYVALVKGFEHVRSFCQGLNITSIATPPIGCGLGGLQKEFVFELLKESFVEYGIDVTVYDIN